MTARSGDDRKVWRWQQGLEMAARSRGGIRPLPTIQLLPDVNINLLPDIKLLRTIKPLPDISL
jgi:hypothetical protein